MCSELSWCMNRGQFKNNFKRALSFVDKEELSELNRGLLKNRFLPMMNTMEVEAKRVNTAFTTFQIVTTLGSIVVPALLSIEDVALQYNSTTTEVEFQNHNLFWITWGISMAVTISNGFNQLLGLERKYILRNISVSQIQKEGWSFLEKSGDVYGQLKQKKLDEIIHIFWKRVEKLRYEQIVTDLTIEKGSNINVDDPDDIEAQIPRSSSRSFSDEDDFSYSESASFGDELSKASTRPGSGTSYLINSPVPLAARQSMTPSDITRANTSSPRENPNMFMRTLSGASTISPLRRDEDQDQTETVNQETIV